MKVLYVTTISNTVNAFLIPHIKMLIDQGHQVDVAFNIEQEVKREIIDMGCTVHQISFQRSPLNKDNFSAYQILKDIIIDEGYDLVHTHTPVASTIVRLVCKNMKNTKVIYTAHGFHFFKGAPLINRLIYYPIERWLARYTDILITINKEDYESAKSFKAKKVEYIPGVGVDIDKYSAVNVDKDLKRKEVGLPKGALVLLSVGELNKNKNHEIVIRALAEIKNTDTHYVICGQGGLGNYLRNLSKELDIEKQVHLLGFRKDIIELCKVSDVFVFPSFREGLSVALMEAMACGMPVVCSNIRGNLDLIEDGKGGYLVEPDDVDGFTKNIEQLIIDRIFRRELGRFNARKIKTYSIENVLTEIKRIYK